MITTPLWYETVEIEHKKLRTELWQFWNTATVTFFLSVEFGFTLRTMPTYFVITCGRLEFFTTFRVPVKYIRSRLYWRGTASPRILNKVDLLTRRSHAVVCTEATGHKFWFAISKSGSGDLWEYGAAARSWVANEAIKVTTLEKCISFRATPNVP